MTGGPACADGEVVDPAERREILRRYAVHARRFERHAESRRRRGLSLVVAEPQEQPERPRITRAERRVLELIADGLTDKQIADVEQLSEFTIKSHVRSLFRKLPANNRPHAVFVGAQRGLLELGAGADSAA